MKNHVSVVVFLLAACGLPTCAQQSTLSSNDQSAASVPEQRERLTAPKAADFWDGDDPNFVNLVTHPFANKKYVQRYTAPIKDRLNELDEIRSEDANKLKDVDGRSQNGIQLASEKVTAQSSTLARPVTRRKAPRPPRRKLPLAFRELSKQSQVSIITRQAHKLRFISVQDRRH